MVPEIFGDTQIMLTLGTYSHVLPEAQVEVVEAVNHLLGGCARRNLMNSESLRMRNWATSELIGTRRRARSASNGLRQAGERLVARTARPSSSQM
jgi:hypothetical protein